MEARSIDTQVKMEKATGEQGVKEEIKTLQSREELATWIVKLHAQIEAIRKEREREIDEYYSEREALVAQLNQTEERMIKAHEQERQKQMEQLDERFPQAAQALARIEDLAQEKGEYVADLMELIPEAENFRTQLDGYRVEKETKFKTVARITKRRLQGELGTAEGERLYNKMKERVVSMNRINVLPIIEGPPDGSHAEEEVEERPLKRPKTEQ